MVKYIIEDGINFWDELNANFDNDIINQENICLISKELLTDNYICLPCSHKFNYISLFKEIKNIKYNKNLYYSNIKLNNNQIICPYCRTIINNLLPYIPSIINEKIKYINYPFKYCLPLFQCTYSNKKVKCLSQNAYLNNGQIYCLKHHTLTDNKKLKLIKFNNLTPEMIKYSKNNKVKDIKNKLKLNNLKYSGLKNELIFRIFENKLN